MEIVDDNRTTTTQTQTRQSAQTLDRLSSLPDEILIQIISQLPITLVVTTGVLSSRWRGLWTNVTSMNIVNLKHCTTYYDLFKVAKDLTTQITTPSFDSLSLELHYVLCWSSSDAFIIDSWLNSLTNRNIRGLKLTMPVLLCQSMPTLQRFIYQTKTLVSIKLKTIPMYTWQVPPDQVNLPNLKNLSLCFLMTKSNEWLKKLIRACPSLENLCLICKGGIESLLDYYIECGNQNLRRLIIYMSVAEPNHRVVINAPRLEYLAVTCRKFPTFCFDEKPIALCEAKVKVINDRSSPENGSWSTFYEGVSNATVLVLDIIIVQHVSTVFRNATWVTLDVKYTTDIQSVLSFLELCPVLDCLTLRFYGAFLKDERWELPTPGLGNIVRRVPREIRVEIHGYFDYNTVNYVETGEYFLRNVVDLARFKYDLRNCQSRRNESVEVTRGRELELCKRLYVCPMASTGCEVEFVGKFFKMSWKAGPKAWDANGEVIALDLTP